MKTSDRSHCEVAVVGAGPYGLAVAAHLRRAGVETRVFGDPMSFWRKRMPKGMYLRSPFSASDIADPDDALTLEAYAREARATFAYSLPLDEFLRYAQWRLAESGVEVEARRSARSRRRGETFLELCEGAPISAYRVVIATGLANQEHRPAPFSACRASWSATVASARISRLSPESASRSSGRARAAANRRRC